MGDVADLRTWNVFRRQHAHGLCCAVPSDFPIPTFLLTGDWTFGFQYTRGDPPVPGFAMQSAEIGARYNGFYLFLGFGTSPGERTRMAAPVSFAEPRAAAGEPNPPLVHSPDAEARPDRPGRSEREQTCPNIPTG